MKYLALALVAALTACASPMKVTKLTDKPIEGRRELALLNATRWDNSLRVALAKHRFTVKKFAGAGIVTETAKSPSYERAHTAEQASTRYALTLAASERDHCLVGDEVKLSASLELTDLATNEVLAVIEKSGWTGRCGFSSGSAPYIFEQLAEAVANQWADANIRHPAGN